MWRIPVSAWRRCSFSSAAGRGSRSRQADLSERPDWLTMRADEKNHRFLDPLPGGRFLATVRDVAGYAGLGGVGAPPAAAGQWRIGRGGHGWGGPAAVGGG